MSVNGYSQFTWSKMIQKIPVDATAGSASQDDSEDRLSAERRGPTFME